MKNSAIFSSNHQDSNQNVLTIKLSFRYELSPSVEAKQLWTSKWFFVKLIIYFLWALLPFTDDLFHKILQQPLLMQMQKSKLFLCNTVILLLILSLEGDLLLVVFWMCKETPLDLMGSFLDEMFYSCKQPKEMRKVRKSDLCIDLVW